MAGVLITRQKHRKKRDEIVTPGPNMGGYLGRDSRPIARSPKYGETDATPGMGKSTELCPFQIQQ